MARELSLTKIPKGWSYGLLDDYAERCSGHTPSKSFPEYWNGGIKWISLADTFRLDKGLVKETDKEISSLGIDNSSAQIHPAGTVVISRDAGIGKSGVMAEPMAVSQHFIAWKCDFNLKAHNWFLYNWLQLNKPEFERQAVGSTIKTIGLPYFKKLKIALPPYEEQRKIAKILSTWDKAIAKTEKLIETSKQQKKALMQQLLTGKKRLVNPETGKVFEEEWEETLISSIAKCFSGGTPSRKKDEYYGGSIPWITSGKLNDRFVCSVNEYITEVGVKNSSAKYVKEGSLLIAMYGATAGKVAINYLVGATINQAILALHVREEHSNTFLFYLLEREMEKAINLVQGGQPNLNASIIKGLKVNIPAFEEQQKIAAVLTAADKEIETLETKLAHFKQEKKALMQQLLTGKRRVKVDRVEGVS
ncbi:restriction endonuclease subunit S [Vibrio nigripulchritudo]|uniref:restriction endonuclease subunit S n=1 Tax=Vibrio nigripulchritudo TaxID=28173 RepID=UPI002493648E|nr:restriction endonuclease subunit S [Vibrio nigripulchritudo]BDU40840.1 type I restriction-modification enzyme, S subunit [Vibrio nigripulchritudo]BDU46577.1 type I restriction-modification enzyme, S subunit [Vibrio nigripulchritudo]